MRSSTLLESPTRLQLEGREEVLTRFERSFGPLARELSDVDAQLVLEYEMYLPDTSDFQFYRHSDL